MTTYNALVAGVGGFGAYSITESGNRPEVAGGLGFGSSLSSHAVQYVIPGPAGLPLKYLFQISPALVQSVIERGSNNIGGTP